MDTHNLATVLRVIVKSQHGRRHSTRKIGVLRHWTILDKSVILTAKSVIIIRSAYQAVVQVMEVKSIAESLVKMSFTTRSMKVTSLEMSNLALVKL